MKPFLFILLALAATPAAALSGTVSGSIQFVDNRQEGDNNAQSLHKNRIGTAQGLSRVRVQVLGGGGGSIGESLTNDNGTFTIAYNDVFAFGYPTSGWKLRVLLEQPGRFSIKNSTGALFAYTTDIRLTGSPQSIGNFGVNDDEQALVFQTTSEFVLRIVETSANLRARMTSVVVTAVAASCCGTTTSSCTLGKNNVCILDGKGLTQPVSSVAHELGHPTTFHSLNVNLPGTECNPQHNWNSVSCEGIAWHEGIANFWAVVFGWSKNAGTSAVFPDPIGTGVFTVEVPDNICVNFPQIDPWLVEACHTAALWDLYDDPSNDDDDIDDANTNTNVATIVDSLNRYPDGCQDAVDNRCSNEDGQATNHWDFLANLDLRFPGFLTEMQDIYATCSIDGGGGPYPPF